MRLVIQRVKSASVTVEGRVISKIGPGLVCLVGLRKGDQAKDTEVCSRKLLNLRLFNDQDTGAMWKRSVMDVRGDILCVSQFTLYGRANKNKPDFCRAMGAAEARSLYADFLQLLRSNYTQANVLDGEFGAMMDVALINDGPVTHGDAHLTRLLILANVRPGATTH